MQSHRGALPARAGAGARANGGGAPEGAKNQRTSTGRQMMHVVHSGVCTRRDGSNLKSKSATCKIRPRSAASNLRTRPHRRHSCRRPPSTLCTHAPFHSHPARAKAGIRGSTSRAPAARGSEHTRQAWSEHVRPPGPGRALCQRALRSASRSPCRPRRAPGSARGRCGPREHQAGEFRGSRLRGGG